MFLRFVWQLRLVYLSFVNPQDRKLSRRLGIRLTNLFNTMARIWEVRKKRASNFTSNPRSTPYHNRHRTRTQPRHPQEKLTGEKPTRSSTRHYIRKPGKRA